MFPLFASNGSLPPDLAETLATSLLNQPPPANGSHHLAGYPPATEIKSRKENKAQGQGIISPSTRKGSFFRLENPATRKASQQTRVPTNTSLPPGTVASATNSPHFFEPKKGFETATCDPSTSHVGANLMGESMPDNALRAVSGNSDKGNKRIRNFTPASSKAIDETDEPSRRSPRIRLSLFEKTEDDNLG